MAVSRVEEQLIAQVSTARLWEANQAIAQWERNSGSEGERAAFEYVRSKLDETGLRTTWLEHPALISYPLTASLAVIDDRGGVLAEFACLGAAYSASVDGLEAEVVDMGYGTDDDYAAVDVAGKVVLVNGLATPTGLYVAEQAGALGAIFINDDRRHYMIVSSIWGTPTPESAGRIPSTPAISVTAADGHDLRARIAAGRVRVRIHSHVFMDWQQTPLLIGELDGQQSDQFVLFSGHLDSWEFGAMDNGSANATLLEVARLLAERGDQLHRGLRLAFWSGHSHGRYSGSTWYVDNHWEEIYDRCVAHVNVDSTGARGATFYGSFLAHLELSGLGAAVLAQRTGQSSQAHRMSRAGDMSFNGAGIPALFMTLSQVPFSDADTDYVSESFGKLIGGKLPWWWHTSEDTLDKVDLEVLKLDTQVYAAAVWRLCHEPLLPMDFRPVIASLRTTLAELDTAAAGHVDLGGLLERADALAAAVERLHARCQAVDPEELAAVDALNRRMMALSRRLIPLLYTAAGPFDHDPAWHLHPLPLLQDVGRLAALDPDSDEFHFLRTRLVRNRNLAGFALRQALEVLA